MYARDIVKGRWKNSEESISKSQIYSLRYAECVLKDRFPEGERLIMKWRNIEPYLEDIRKEYINFLIKIDKLDEFLEDCNDIDAIRHTLNNCGIKNV